jgi:glycosyltransferase involved in cell wall biosynthesis
MGEAGRRRVKEHFTVEAMVRKHIEVYERLLAETKG